MTERGCGSRVDQSLYAFVPVSPFGKPIDYFLVDPSIKFEVTNLRAPMLVPDPAGTYHAILGVGKEFYPTVPDFVEEARVMGVSKRLPSDFDPSKLTPERSKFLLFHPKAIPKFSYYPVLGKCPTGKPKEGNTHECLGELWPLSVLEGSSSKHSFEFYRKGIYSVKTPSASYDVKAPRVPKQKALKGAKSLPYLSGIFLSFPTFGFQYVSKSGKVPQAITDRFKAKGIVLEVVPE